MKDTLESGDLISPVNLRSSIIFTKKRPLTWFYNQFIVHPFADLSVPYSPKIISPILFVYFIEYPIFHYVAFYITLPTLSVYFSIIFPIYSLLNFITVKNPFLR